MADDRPQSLCGKDQSSFAFLTIRDRLPEILTRVIDGISRLTKQHLNTNDEVKADDCKAIISRLVKLKNELQTDKEITILSDSYGDCQAWNYFISNSLKPVFNLGVSSMPTWFSVAWLSCECYMYRRIFQAFQLSQHHQSFDPFLVQKQTSMQSSNEAMITLAEQLVLFTKSSPKLDMDDTDAMKDLRAEFEVLLEYSLWGNKCDLSLSAGALDNNQLEESSQLKLLLEHILVNDTGLVWQHIVDTAATNKQQRRIDIVLDNSGFEVFSDLCFAAFLIKKSLFSTVHFHVKSMPWFVSDASDADFQWAIEHCRVSEHSAVRDAGEMWSTCLREGSFVVRQHAFWTYPHDYPSMANTAADLYDELSQSQLVLFKGDLNYRKLIGDRAWPHATEFAEALHGFRPAPLVTLRTLKADLVVGLPPGKDLEMMSKDEKWMVNGNYAVIQFCPKK